MHYKNGRGARSGDIVVGTTYNRKGQQIGIVHNIKEGHASCNCMVTTGLDALHTGYSGVLFSASLKNGNPDCDYSECGHLLHIEDYIKSLSPVQIVEGSDTPLL